MEHVKELLSEYLDGELAGPERQRVQGHLDSCGDCRRELEELKGVSSMVSSLPRRPLPAGFMERLQRRREAQGRGWVDLLIPLWRPAGMRLAAVATCGLLVTVVVYEKAADRLFPSAVSGISGAASSLDGDAAPAMDQFARTAAVRGSSNLEAPARFRQDLKDKNIGEPLGGGGAGVGGALSGGKAQAHTNESLHGYLETEKKRMGIQKILPLGSQAVPEPQDARVPPEYARSMDEARGHMRRMAADMHRLVQARQAPTVPIKGDKPALLSKSEDTMPAAGEPVAEGARKEAEEVANALTPPPAERGSRALGRAVPASAPASPAYTGVRRAKLDSARAWGQAKEKAQAAPGTTARSTQELAEAWKRLGLEGAFPEVDFSKQMVILAPQGSRILDITEKSGKIVVRVALGPAPAQEGREADSISSFYRVVPLSSLPVDFIAAPKP